MSATVEVPVTVRLVMVVVARVEVPKMVSVPDAKMSPPTVTLPPTFCPPEIVEVPTYKMPVVIAVAEAVFNVVCPDTKRLVAVVVARVEVPVTPRVPPTVWLPVIVEVPTVTVLAVR